MSSSNEEIIPEDKGDFGQDQRGWRRPQQQRNFYPDLEEKEAVMNDRTEFLDRPRCRGVVEWINCLLFDGLLLVLEAAINLWLASSLERIGLISEYRAIIAMLILPSLLNPAIWMVVKKNYKISAAFVTTLLIFGFPSPLFVYLWHLYLSMFASLRESENSKLMANSFRMVHACICSMPLMVINMSTMINQLRVDGLEDWAIDIRELNLHMEQVHMHGLAFILSFINFTRAACLFNERETMTLLFSLVALPMTLLNALCRILLLAIVIAFVEPEWTTILLAGLILANAVLLWSCRKRTKVVKGSLVSPVTMEDLNPPPCSAPGSQQCLTSCCCGPNAIQSIPTTKSGQYVLTRSPSSSDSCWHDLGNILSLSVASLLVPSGYANDAKMFHPRIKGGLYLILNYLVNMSILGVTLGYTILHRVPNDIHGIKISNPSIDVVVPSAKIKIKTGFTDIAVKLPDQNMNLASMPSIDASINTDSSDEIHAIIVPVVLSILCLPFTLMRAAMMELDCFVTRKKQLGDDFDDYLVLQSSGKSNNRRFASFDLRDILAQNVDSKELKCRLYTAICCSGLGMMAWTVFIMLTGAFIYMNL